PAFCVDPVAPLEFRSDPSAFAAKPVTYTCPALPWAVKADALAAISSQTANATSVEMTLIRARPRSADPGRERPPSPARLRVTLMGPPSRIMTSLVGSQRLRGR